VKRFIHGFVSVLVLLFLAASAFTVLADSEKKEAPKAPDFTAKNLKGKEIKLSDLLEEGPVLVDFWTTWCKPCMLELPQLDRIHRTYAEHGFKAIAISQDDTKTVRKVKPLVKQKKLDLLVLVDPSREVGTKYGVRNYPTSFLIDKDQRIVHYAQGYNKGDEKELEELVRGLLGLEAGESADSEKDK
jgi:peroxiredoxin